MIEQIGQRQFARRADETVTDQFDQPGRREDAQQGDTGQYNQKQCPADTQNPAGFISSFPVQDIGKSRHKSRRQGPFCKKPAQQVRYGKGNKESIRHHAGTEDCGNHHVANQAGYSAGNRGNAQHASGPGNISFFTRHKQLQRFF